MVSVKIELILCQFDCEIEAGTLHYVDKLTNFIKEISLNIIKEASE